MKKSRFSEALIVGILTELEAGSPATELGRRHGVHPNTIRLWKDRYAGLESSDLARLKQLEAENAQMQRIIARQTIEIDAVRTLIENRLGLLYLQSCHAEHSPIWRTRVTAAARTTMGPLGC